MVSRAAELQGSESFYGVVDGENCQGLNQLLYTKLNWEIIYRSQEMLNNGYIHIYMDWSLDRKQKIERS